jgi:hypothetical protein
MRLTMIGDTKRDCAADQFQTTLPATGSKADTTNEDQLVPGHALAGTGLVVKKRRAPDAAG